MPQQFPQMSRRIFLASTAAAAGCSATITVAASRSQGYVDSLSFLPDDLREIGQAGLRAMICDISRVATVHDAQGIPRYTRDFDSNLQAINEANTRLANSPFAFVAAKGSDIGTRAGCATFLQFQSCEPIGTDLSRMAMFHGKGLRIIQLTHHNNNLFAGGAIEPTQCGLTPLGREGLAEMNRVGLIADVSHGSVPTMLEVAKASRRPVILSHGACRAIVDHPRCAPDEVIRAIADTGGTMGVFMMSFWLTRDRVPTMAHLIAQIRHVIRVGGIDSVSIANDFPMSGEANLVKLNNDNAEGVKGYLDWWNAMNSLGVPGFEQNPEHVVIPELNHIDRMRRIARALDRARFNSRQIEKIMGGNVERVLRDALG